jgi:hypothetical protein
MDVLELLNRRKHVTKFSNVVPPKELIEKVLWKSWKVTPSKQNFMPYSINVLGPNNISEKQKVLNLSRFNKKRVNEKANINNIENFSEDGYNANFEFLASVPYLLICSQRVCEPNAYISKSIKDKNDIFEQMYEHLLEDAMKTASTEVGMFKSNLTAFCLEEKLDISCISCTPQNPKFWQEVGLEFVKYPVILLIGIGYCEQSRQENLNQKQKMDDLKPEVETIINWI